MTTIDRISRHIHRYPHARPSTLIQLRKQDEMTERLRQEIDILQEQLDRTPAPWWRRVFSALRNSRSAPDE